MDPITIAAISTVVAYMAKTFADTKSFKDFTNEFSEESIKWVKPIFLKEAEDKPKEVVEKLQEKPDSNARQNQVKAALEVAIEDDAQLETHIQAMAKEIEAKKKRGESVSIVNSKNVIQGSTIHVGGNFRQGDTTINK
ncbi:MAG: hypothetical protein R3E32_02935 [Chitinophagales bacterium]